jgi:hypothetical protein
MANNMTKEDNLKKEFEREFVKNKYDEIFEDYDYVWKWIQTALANQQKELKEKMRRKVKWAKAKGFADGLLVNPFRKTLKRELLAEWEKKIEGMKGWRLGVNVFNNTEMVKKNDILALLRRER